jgi:hypothetical protein
MFIMFVMFFVFILLPCHKYRESMKIGPHPWGQPLSLLTPKIEVWRKRGSA